MRRLVCSFSLLVAAGCDCAGASTANCTQLCSDDAESGCPAGMRCERGCCQCAPADEVCDGIDQNCNRLPDDGLEASCACAPGGPGMGAESCNGIDDDCNGSVDDGVPTTDETCNALDDDCDGTADDGLSPTVCPCAPGGAGPSAEVCNGVDDDCDGTKDDGLSPTACPCAPGGTGPGNETCNNADDDCNASVDDGTVDCACAPGGPGPGPELCNRRDDDCNEAVDDGTMACGGASLCACAPGGPGPGVETCNGTDDDCNGMIDEALDACACTGCGSAGGEACNQLDDDCNGAADDGLDPALCACAPGGPGPGVETCNGTDDDCDATIDDGLMNCACAPGGPGRSSEVCNGIDDDCDGTIDDSLTGCACSPGGPGRSMEVCNRIDDDCDGQTDEINSRNGMPCRDFGEPCTANSDCSSQLCGGDAFDPYCTETCTMPGTSPGDCAAGYRCWDNPSVGGVDQCRRNYGACARDADCGPAQVCAPTCNDAGTGVVTECRPAIPGGRAAPIACSRNSDCASNDCFRTGICTEVCASDADCGTGHRCVLVRFPGCGGRGYVPRCLDACDCDNECPAGQLCQPYVHQVVPPATRTTEGACDISYGPLAPGADCDNTMGQFCAHAICSRGGTGYCTQVCSATCGCPTGIGPCGPTTVTFGDLGSYPAMTCNTL